MARLFCYVSVLFCAACGPSAGTDMDAASRFFAMNAEFDGVDPSDPAQLPVSGSANYNGVAVLNLPLDGPPKTVYGNLTLAVDFGRNHGGVSGDIKAFRY